jgi:hypothetical protein
VEFSDAVQEMKDAGWELYKDEDDAWCHLCQSCQEERDERTT